MPQVFVTDRSGHCETLDFQPGTTLMQTITDAGIAELLALCGGVCSCATCHVYVTGPATAALPAMGDDENGLLEFAEHRRGNSRLSCQIRLDESLDGLEAMIAPEE